MEPRTSTIERGAPFALWHLMVSRSQTRHVDDGGLVSNTMQL
jgi:hypothetical protein